METTGEPGGSLSQQCSNCDSTSARCWCLDCNEALCDVCVSAHRRVTMTRSHKLLHQPPDGSILSPPTKFCRIHPSEQLKLFCFTCNLLTCRDCQLMAHKNHRYQFVSEAMVTLKKQLEICTHSIRRQEDAVRKSVHDMEIRLQCIVKSQFDLRTVLQKEFIAFAHLLKWKLAALFKDIQKVYSDECEQIQMRMTKLKQLQQNQISVRETTEKAGNLTDLPSLITHTAQIRSQLKDLLDQDSYPPPNMSAVKVITTTGLKEAISEFYKIQVSWIPFSVSPTSEKSPETPTIPPSTSTCSPSSTVTSGSGSLLLTKLLSPPASIPRTDSTSSLSVSSNFSSTCPVSSSPQSETTSYSASHVSRDCVSTSATTKPPSPLTFYSLLTKGYSDSHLPAYPQSVPSKSASGQSGHAPASSSTCPTTSNTPLPSSCHASGAPPSQTSPLRKSLSIAQCFPSASSPFTSSSPNSVTAPAQTSTHPVPSGPINQTGTTSDTPVTISNLSPHSASSSSQLSPFLSSSVSSITPSTSTYPAASGSTHLTGTTSNIYTPVTISNLSSLPASSASQLSLSPSSTSPYSSITPSSSTHPAPTGRITQTDTSSDMNTPVTISNLSSHPASSSSQLSLSPSSTSPYSSITPSSSTHPAPTGPNTQTDTSSDMNTPVTISDLSSLSVPLSSQLSIPAFCTTSTFNYSSSITPSASTHPVPTGLITHTGTTSDINRPVSTNSLSLPSVPFSSQLGVPPSSTSLSTSTYPVVTTMPHFQALDTGGKNTLVSINSRYPFSFLLLSSSQSNRPLSSFTCSSSVAPPPSSSTCLTPSSMLIPQSSNINAGGLPLQINRYPMSRSTSSDQFHLMQGQGKPPIYPKSTVALACSTATSTTTSTTTPSKCISTCPVTSFSHLPQTGSSNNIASVVPVSIPSSLWNFLSPSSTVNCMNSFVTPLTSTFSAPTQSTILQTKTSNSVYSLVPINHFSASQTVPTTTTPAFSSFITSSAHATIYSSPTYWSLCQTDTNSASVVQCLSRLPASSRFPQSASQSFSIVESVQPSLVLNQVATLHQNQPTLLVLTSNQNTYQVLLNETAFFTLPGNGVPHQATMQKPNSLTGSTIREVSPVSLKHQTLPEISSNTLPSNQQTMQDKSLLSSLQEPVSDSRLSSWGHQQHISLVDLMVDLTCENSRQQMEEEQETEGTEPTTSLSTPETSRKDSKEPRDVIERYVFSLSQWQPRVSVLRLPLSLPSAGQPLPYFRLIPGETEDEIYLEEMSENSESDDDDVPDDGQDFTKTLSPPESPMTLEILSCSVCASPGTSIICSACGRGYHRECHVPPVGPDFWMEWLCSLCQDLSDPSDPYSTERLQSTFLSLQSQRRCESLVLYLKVEVCGRCSEFGDLSRLKVISDRLTLRRSPPYQTAAQLVSDIWTLFKDAPQDDELNKLRDSFQKKLVETMSSEVHPSLLIPPKSNPQPSGCTNSSPCSKKEESGRLTMEKEAVLTQGSKLKNVRKRLKDFLDLKGSPMAKRTKKEEE